MRVVSQNRPAERYCFESCRPNEGRRLQHPSFSIRRGSANQLSERLGRWRKHTRDRRFIALSGASDQPVAGKLETFSSFAANLFPVWLIIAGSAALLKPELFLWFQKDYVTFGLAFTMLSMGTSLTLEDFTGVMKRPGLVGLGAALQYTIMPFMGFATSRLAGVSPPIAVGLCLIACCPGGVASNVVTFLAGADVPLSVLMTSVSTFAAAVATPFLVKLLVGSLVPVNAASLMLSTLQVVLAPVVLGAVLNQSFPRQMKQVEPVAPLIAVMMTVLICASVLAQNASAVKAASIRLIAAVAALHSGGFLLGYVAPKLLKVGERQSRTISIEVGMQNSTLGAVLALAHFSDPLTAVPCAISACLHSIIGSALAAFFRRQDAHSLEGSRNQELDLPSTPSAESLP